MFGDEAKNRNNSTSINETHDETKLFTKCCLSPHRFRFVSIAIAHFQLNNSKFDSISISGKKNDEPKNMRATKPELSETAKNTFDRFPINKSLVIESLIFACLFTKWHEQKIERNFKMKTKIRLRVEKFARQSTIAQTKIKPFSDQLQRFDLLFYACNACTIQRKIGFVDFVETKNRAEIRNEFKWNKCFELSHGRRREMYVCVDGRKQQ